MLEPQRTTSSDLSPLPISSLVPLPGVLLWSSFTHSTSPIPVLQPTLAEQTLASSKASGTSSKPSTRRTASGASTEDYQRRSTGWSSTGAYTLEALTPQRTRWCRSSPRCGSAGRQRRRSHPRRGSSRTRWTRYGGG